MVTKGNNQYFWGALLLSVCIMHSACKRDINGFYSFEGNTKMGDRIDTLFTNDTIALFLYMEDELGDSKKNGAFSYTLNSSKDSIWITFDSIEPNLTIAAKVRYSLLRGYYSFDLDGERGFQQFATPSDIRKQEPVSTEELIREVELGNEDEYIELVGRLGTGTMPYSILMANAFKNPQAAYDVYRWLIGVCEEADVHDTLTYALAVQYLERAAQLDSLNYNELGELYFMGQYVNRDTIKAREYLNLATKDQELRNSEWQKWSQRYNEE